MTVIAPAILTDSVDVYKEQVERLQGVIDTVHIDYTDGEFAPSFTVGIQDIWWPKEWKAAIHAMVVRPSEHLPALIKLKPDMIILHAETQEDITPAIQAIKAAGIRAGVALLKSTAPSRVKPLIEAADHVMIFSGDLGKHGGKASMMQLEKVRLIHAIRPNVEIGWDGGVTLDNAYSLAQGGVDVLNAGGLFSDSLDPKATYDKMLKEVAKHSII